MAMHLFSTPVECTNCGTVVDDPTVDKCPKCEQLLTERRTPGRLAGVERRYRNIRFLLSFIRFLAVITAGVGILVFMFSDDSVPWTARLASVLGALVIASALLVIASLFDLALDMEENTRASFKVQQLMLEELQRGGKMGRAARAAREQSEATEGGGA
ncbi:MAG: hypothetical protein H0U67_14155 [Gemmatimonadetes bacterium]|nr:hypothetical protein [Gemmatimonadota bacterium]